MIDYYQQAQQQEVHRNGRAVEPAHKILRQATTTFFVVEQSNQNEDQKGPLSSTIVGDTSTIEVSGNERKESSCYICFTHQPAVVYLTCMHGGICKECSLVVMNGDRKCSLCRAEVAGLLEIAHLEQDLFKVLVQRVYC